MAGTRMRRIAAWTCLALVAAAGPAFGGCEKEEAMADVMLGSADKGRVVEVGMAGRVMLQLPERPSTGYRWELQANGESLALETDSYVPGGSLQPGAGGLHSFCFRPRTPGETILRLQLRQPWDAASPAAETYEVTLRVVPDGAK